MDGFSAEVSEKIRAAIRAKLVSTQKVTLNFNSLRKLLILQRELDAYVDDELPDYIMVLVANKKTKDQMKEDLGLFLHQHAEVFTTWLQDILNKLQQVTKPKTALATAESKSKKVVKKKEKKEKKKSKSSPKDPSKKSKKVKKVKTDSKVKSRPRSRSPGQNHGLRDHFERPHPREQRDHHDNSRLRDTHRHDHRERYPESRDHHRSRSDSRSAQHSRDHHRGHPRDSYSSSNDPECRDRSKSSSMSSSVSPNKKLKSSVVQVQNNEGGGEYDPETILKKSLNSRVQVPAKSVKKSDRKSGSKLILKAVQDADKSLSQRRAESRQKDQELEEIHRRRMKATNEARKFKGSSDLDEVHKNRMKATIEAKRFKTGSADLDEVHKNRMKATIEAKKFKSEDLPDEVQTSRMKATIEAKKFKASKVSSGSPVKTKKKVKKKVKRPPTPSSSSNSSDDEDQSNENEDLRLRLENRRRKTQNNRKMIVPPSPEKAPAKPEQAVVVPEKKIIRLTKQQSQQEQELDAELEMIRQRALSSMLRNQQQKKIIIPLNETSSSEYSDDDDLSLSSNYSNTNAEQKKQPLQVRNLSEFFVKASI